MVQLTQRKLRIWNGAVGLFMLATAVIIFAITDYDLTAPWYTTFIASRDPDGDRSQFYTPSPKKQADVPVCSQESCTALRQALLPGALTQIGALSGIFLALSAIDHLLTVLPGINGWYHRKLLRNQNPLRWIEYAWSASLMRVQIGMLSGIVDIHTLFGVFMLTATTMLFGWQMETLNGDRLAVHNIGDSKRITDGLEANGSGSHSHARINWQPFLFGGIPHLAAWAVLACHFFRNVSEGDTPNFVWAIIFIVFILDACFAVVQLLQFARVKGFRGFAHAEFAYIILSLTSKQLLAWIEFGGAQSLKPE